MDPPPRKKHAGSSNSPNKPKPASKAPLSNESESTRITTPSHAPLKMETTAVSLQAIVEARRNEIIAFESAVIGSSGGTGGGSGHHRRAFQLLPRHMRRRAMSYNPYLVPLRLRSLAIKQSENTSAPKTKLFRRKRAKSRQTSKQGQWLATHLWHSKRFKMVQYSNFKIPYQTSNRARKPAWRAAKVDCVALDTSFLQPLSITGPKSSIVKLFQKINMDHDHHVMDYQIRRLNSAFAFKKDQKHQNQFVPIAPIQLFGRKLSNTNSMLQFYIWVDPHAFNELKEYIHLVKTEDITLSSMEGLWSRFEIIGPKSGKILSKMLVPVDSSTQKQISKYFSNRPQMIPCGTTLMFEVNDPRFSKLLQKASKVVQPDNPSSTASNEPLLSQQLSQLVLYGMNDNSSFSNHHIDECPLWKEDFLKDKNNEQKYGDHEVTNGAMIPKIIGKSKTWIIVQRFEEGGDDYEGWIVYTMKSWASSFWKRFVLSGARPIGLRERNDLRFESLRPRFPQDFPGTLSYHNYISKFAMDLEMAWNRRPSQKKLNFKKLGINSPFIPDWDSLINQNKLNNDNDTKSNKNNDGSNQKKMIVDDSDEKENKVVLSYRFGYLNDEYIGANNSGNPSKQNLIKLTPIYIILKNGGTSLRYNAHIYQIEKGAKPSKSPIGFVTSGAYSYDIGKCTAIGFILESAARKILKDEDEITDKNELQNLLANQVLVRNVTSTMYHVAEIGLLEPTYG